MVTGSKRFWMVCAETLIVMATTWNMQIAFHLSPVTDEPLFYAETEKAIYFCIKTSRHEGVEVKLHLFLTSALCVSGQRRAPVALPRFIPCIRELGAPQSHWRRYTSIRPFCESEPRLSGQQPITITDR
jgi:hypothetical protein